MQNLLETATLYKVHCQKSGSIHWYPTQEEAEAKHTYPFYKLEEKRVFVCHLPEHKALILEGTVLPEPVLAQPVITFDPSKLGEIRPIHVVRDDTGKAVDSMPETSIDLLTLALKHLNTWGPLNPGGSVDTYVDLETACKKASRNMRDILIEVIDRYYLSVPYIGKVG